MKKIIISLLLALAIISAQAQTKTDTLDPWTNYMTPGAVHQFLKNYTGEWNMEITMWMSADQQPQVVAITSSNSSMFGGRFLEMKQKGNMMGMDYEAAIGFNNTTKQFELTSVTNMGTGMLSLKGSWDDANKVATVRGEIANPMDGKPIAVRQVLTFKDRDTIAIDNFDKVGNGNERRSIQYKLTRRK